jgi:mRNA interferase HigB
MRIIAKRTLLDFVRCHPGARQVVLAWRDEVAMAGWSGPQEIRERYVSASFVGRDRVIFNLRGNAYRLVVAVAYQIGVVYVKFIGSHAEYDRIDAVNVEQE